MLGSCSLYFSVPQVGRVSAYPHSIEGGGLDHCYDCSSEVHIIRSYLERFAPSLVGTTVADHGAQEWPVGVERSWDAAAKGRIDEAVLHMSKALSQGSSIKGRMLESEVLTPPCDMLPFPPITSTRMGPGILMSLAHYRLSLFIF